MGDPQFRILVPAETRVIGIIDPDYAAEVVAPEDYFRAIRLAERAVCSGLGLAFVHDMTPKRLS